MSKSSNPLYAAWKRYGFVREFGRWREPMLTMEEMGGDPMVAVMSLGRAMIDRQTLVRKYSWAVPSTAAIKWIAERCPSIVEIGAGRGYWAMLLAQAGVDILAFDEAGRGKTMARNPYHYIPAEEIEQKVSDDPELYESLAREFAGQTNKVFYQVGFGRAKVAALHPKRTLMLCWPPYGEPMASQALRFYQGKQVLFIGEHQGATGNETFFKRLENDWEQIGDFAIPQWPGMNDAVYLYQRKTNIQLSRAK